MSLDVSAIAQAIGAHGPVARILVARIQGSAPREAGASMLVWEQGQSGTIGGGELEFRAVQAARAALRAGASARRSRHALGPELGQCCGGAVDLVTEVFAAAPEPAAGGLRALCLAHAHPQEPPLAVRRIMAQARSAQLPDLPRLTGDWLIERIARRSRPVWIWGAGHVGRALVSVLAPLPDLKISWIDTAPDRFPARKPALVEVIPAEAPAALVRHAPAQAEHLVLTYSHALDLDLCHALLRHDFAFAGLIGSKTKWARFRSRLSALGHSPQAISRITCPIGDPALGKHPQAVAVSVAADILRRGANARPLQGHSDDPAVA